ncbi:YqaA family protein [Bacillus carboniphilus]|uniref:YqaA family protein n=1 Tax=Bacillus carboniphilus TaxID=86663 RepID=A0ABN0WAJ6_9BACI
MVESVVEFFEKFGFIGMFLHSFLDAIIFPIPAFFLQVSLSILDPSNALWLATIGYIACLLGTPIGYLIGKVLGESVLYKLLKKKWIDAASEKFNKNGEAAILIGAFTPIPFKVFTILSGCFHFSFWKLIGYAAIGRAVKFYIVGTLFYFYGAASASFVKEELSIILAAVAVLLIIGYLFKKKRQSKHVKVRYQESKEESL